MHEDAQLVSFEEGTYFWNQNDIMGLNRQDCQNFNRFSELKTIDLSRLKVSDGNDIEKLFIDHTEMTQDLRKALLDNPNKQDHEKLVIATQFTFMLIMWAAFKCYTI